MKWFVKSAMSRQGSTGDLTILTAHASVSIGLVSLLADVLTCETLDDKLKCVCVLCDEHIGHTTLSQTVSEKYISRDLSSGCFERRTHCFRLN